MLQTALQTVLRIVSRRSGTATRRENTCAFSDECSNVGQVIRMSIDVDDELLADVMRQLPEMSTEEVVDHALRRLIYPSLVRQPVFRA
ncbi:hypothetical protein Misp02_47410 [Microtetraspora sp. NBRC 16547]|nr:hypothetical protein Misp02_47410 [Microtetraspora sp. NBRC 16547]